MDKYGDIHNRLDDEKRKLHQLQIDNLRSPHPDILQAEHTQSKTGTRTLFG